jgi:S1-C subfamily serine protease
MQPIQLSKYFQLLGYILTAVILISVGFFIAAGDWRGFLAGINKQPELDDPIEILVGEILFTTEVLPALPSGERTVWLNSARQSSGLRKVGMGLVFDDSHIVTAAHVVESPGSYYFYNPGVTIVQLQSFEAYKERDLAFGTFSDRWSLKVPNNIILANEISQGEIAQMWVSGDTGLKHIEGVITQKEKQISLQQAWGETQVSSLNVVEMRASNNLGDSGSPVFNQKGEVIGLVVGVDLEDLYLTYITRL